MIKNKLAQYTTLDKVKKDNDKPDYYHHNEPEQQVLPFYGPEPKFSDYQTWQQWNANQSNVKPSKEIKKQKPFEPPNLNFPEITQEHIRSRNYTPEEIAKMQAEKERLIEKAREEGYTNQYYRGGNQYEIQNIDKQLQKSLSFLPEEIKKEALTTYQKLRETSARFYVAYKEANELAQTAVEIDYDDTYTNLVKQFPQILIQIIKRQIGAIFGLTGGRHDYHQTETARYLLNRLKRGFNLFNLTPDNAEDEIATMKETIIGMDKLLNLFERRKKVLIKLPEEIKDVSKAFLQLKSNREFLKFMEDHFPGEKEDFVNKSMTHLYGGGYSSARQNKAREHLNLDDLTTVKTYKSIFERAQMSAGHNFPEKMKEMAKGELSNRLQEEINERLKKKIAFLALWGKELSPQNLNEFVRYCYKEYRLDLGSILKFALTMVDKKVESKYPDLVKDDPKAVALYKEDNKKAFIDRFFQLFDKKLTYLKEHGFIGEYIADVRQQLQSKSIKEFAQLTEKDLNDAINQQIYKLIVSQIPNFSDVSSTNDFPDFRHIASMIKQTGKFSIEAFTNFVYSKLPIIPKEFVLNLVRTIFKGANQQSDPQKILNSFEIINQTQVSTQNTVQIFLDLLKKSGKSNPDSFTKYFISSFQVFRKSYAQVASDLSAYKTPNLIHTVVLHAIRSMDTMERDLSNLIKFVSFIHNEAGKLTGPDIIRIIDSKNFINFEKFGIIRKMLQSYSEIKNQGGLAGIHKKYGPVIKEMTKNKYISPNFYDNIRYIQQTFKANEYISPMSENFNKLFETCSAVETDLEILEMSETFKDLMKDYEKKDENLFKLDFQISPNLRFRVLKDMDPRILRVGVESNSCQRIGGIAESSAKDSFVNPLAGVIILEWEHEGEWKLLTQSYFHYVPKDNAFILDNVEDNAENVKRSNINLEVCYAYLADYVKDKYDIKYFVAGKGYSDIENDDFDTIRLEEDPRSFSPKATYGDYRNKVYTDFSPYDAVNLLSPKFNLDERLEKIIGTKEQQFSKQEKKAFKKILRGLIFKY